MRIAFILLINLGFLFIHTLDAQNISFTAKTDGKQVLEGQPITITYSLNSNKGINFSAPDFKPFTVASGPSQSTSMQIINGRSTSSISYSYTLIAPSKQGRYTIKPASINFNGKVVQSNMVQVEVLKGKKNASGKGEQYYVEVQISHPVAYVGQQLLLDYKLYTKQDVRSFNLIGEPDYAGFYATDVNIRVQTEREIINGEEYYTKVMKRVLLFPQQTGTYTIGPINAQLGFKPANSPGGNYFFSRVVKKNVLTNSIEIPVMDLPQNFSLANSNAVGNYSMNSLINKNRVTTDDAITVEMTVTGDGDAKFVMPPKFLNTDEFDVYDPNVTVDETFQQNNRVYHRKKFEYLAVPKKPGQFFIKPEFQFFNPDSNKYITLEGRQKRIYVTQGTGNKDAELLEQSKIVELSPIATVTTFTKNVGGFYKSIPYFGIILMCLLFIGYSAFLYRKRKLEGSLDPMAILREKARKIALAKLEKATEFKSKNERKSFYEEIIRAVKEYLSDKYNIPATHLNKASITTSLQSKNVDDSDIERLQNLFDTCELNLYASNKDSNMDQSFNEAKEILEKLEASFSE